MLVNNPYVMCDNCSYIDTSSASLQNLDESFHSDVDDEYQPSDGLPAGKVDEFPTFEADDCCVCAGCTICIDGVRVGKRMMVAATLRVVRGELHLPPVQDALP